MLREGELDTLFTARAPSSFIIREKHIARLFPDTRIVERAYYQKTGLFPIMHLIGIRKNACREISLAGDESL
jgi:4,5-dihydroxyphthalate decarboxylase